MKEVYAIEAERRIGDMRDQFSRTRLLLGDAAMERLAAARVAVFGIGGVGGHAAEALARSGIEHPHQGQNYVFSHP